MKRLMKSSLPVIAVVLLAWGLSGCGKVRPDFFVLVENANGVAPETKVMWRGVQVGTVSAVKPEAGKIRIDVRLAPEYKGQIRVGVKAKVMHDSAEPGKPILNLLGGSDTTAPALLPGAQVPEASLLDTLRYTSFWDWFSGMGYGKWFLIAFLVVLISVVLALKVFKGLGRLLALALAILLVVGSVWVLRQQWDKYKSSLVSPEVQQQIDKILGFDVRSPEAREAWSTIKNDFKELRLKARDEGSAALDSLKKKTATALSQKADELRKRGNQNAAQELENIGKSLDTP